MVGRAFLSLIASRGQAVSPALRSLPSALHPYGAFRSAHTNTIDSHNPSFQAVAESNTMEKVFDRVGARLWSAEGTALSTEGQQDNGHVESKVEE